MAFIESLKNPISKELRRQIAEENKQRFATIQLISGSLMIDCHTGVEYFAENGIDARNYVLLRDREGKPLINRHFSEIKAGLQ